MTVGISELATAGNKLRTGTFRSGSVFGFAVHTTGSGIVDKAIKKGADPFQYALDYYLSAEFYAQYLIGYDGKIAQICDERVRAQHIGFKERAAFLYGTWEKTAQPVAVRLWRAAWPGFKSPAHLFPGASPNEAFVGAEMLPIPSFSSRWQPAFEGATFTLAQHQSVVLLARDVARRSVFPAGWHDTSRLLGHEDVNPLTRSDKGGGWDPGALRERPRFAMWWVRKMCGSVDAGPISALPPA